MLGKYLSMGLEVRPIFTLSEAYTCPSPYTLNNYFCRHSNIIRLYIFFVVPFLHTQRSFGLQRLLLTLLILSFLPLLTPWHPLPFFLIPQLYRCRHRLPLLLKHELLGKLNSSGSWREKVCWRHVVVMVGAREKNIKKVKTRRQEGIG